MIRKLVKDTALLSIPSEDASLEDKDLIVDLKDTFSINFSKCVGMAANMIGVNKKIIVVVDNKEPLIMINPKIIKTFGEAYLVREGCLCLHGEREAMRFKKIQVEYLNEDFKKIQRTFLGITAQAIQHEMDHLKGRII